jgi:hypothetical protein
VQNTRVATLPPALDTVLLIHRIVGYPLAFVVAPLALATFAGRPRHRAAGVVYAVLMTFLYLTGSSLTFTQYPWDSWEFGRNVAFNLLGFLFLLNGVRAIYLWRNQDAPKERPARLDRALFALTAVAVALMGTLAVVKNTPLRIFTVLGVTLLVLDRRDWRAGFSRAVLYARHTRYILASYFYVLTVVSLVHLRDELAVNVRWLWPSVIGVAVIWIADRAARPGAASRANVNRWAMRATLTVALLFGAYTAFELVRDGGLSPNPPRATVRAP